MTEYTKEQIKGLRERWQGHEVEVKNLIPIIKSDPDWHKSKTYQDLMQRLPPLPEGVDETEKDLRGAYLWGVELSGANLWRADLPGADLSRANLSGANLMGANLSGADLREANLSGAYLAEAVLSGAYLIGANLSGAYLRKADMSGADLWGADLSGADLSRADLLGADLADADLPGAYLAGVFYTTDEVFNRLTKWWFPFLVQHIPLLQHVPVIKHVIKKMKPTKVTNFLRVDTTKVDGSKNPVLKRHIEDYQFVQAFKEKSWFHKWFFYPIWKYTCDCGRSLLLWLIWSLGLVVIFSIIYSSHLHWFKQSPELAWFDVLYFSVVTFTTLGFGDVTPHHGNVAAQSWIMFEVVIGYIMLGGLVSILANKLARRA